MELGVLCSGGLGYANLFKLEKSYHISFVFTDSKSEKIINYCKEKFIPLFIGNPRKGKAKDFIEKCTCDYLISINYLFVIENDVIEIAKKMTFNIHGSLLPKYRGRTPHVWSIINNEKEAGITAHIINEGCDTGEVLEQIKIPIKEDYTGNDLLELYHKYYYELIENVLKKAKNNNLEKIAQDESKATYFGKRTRDDGLIDWNWHKERIINWVRAQAYPYPGAFGIIDDRRVIIDKIIPSDLGYRQEDANGLILKSTNSGVIVKTPNGCLELVTIRENKQYCIKGKIFNNE